MIETMKLSQRIKNYKSDIYFSSVQESKQAYMLIVEEYCKLAMQLLSNSQNNAVHLEQQLVEMESMLKHEDLIAMSDYLWTQILPIVNEIEARHDYN